MVHNTNSLQVGGSDAWEHWNIARGDDVPLLPASAEAQLSFLGLRLVTEEDIPRIAFHRRPLEEPAGNADPAAAEA